VSIVVSVYFVMTQSGNFWIHLRIRVNTWWWTWKGIRSTHRGNEK